MRRRFRFIPAVAAACAFAAIPVAAQVSSGAAALIVFPHVVIDSSRELDTIVELVNASDDEVEVRCLYEDLTPVCLGTGTCVPRPSLCAGPCASRTTKIPFRVRLTAHQPLGWSVARGLSELPITDNGPFGQTNLGTHVPSIDEQVFQGTLRCVVVDDAGHPTDNNALAGTASIETRAESTASRVDAAQYNAIALPAVAGANDGDELLHLGGPQAEYSACPGSLVLSHVTDDAFVRTGVAAGTASTTVALVPCGGDLLDNDLPGAVIQMFVYNEYSQRFSTSIPISGQLVTRLSLIDTTQSDRSIFAAGVLGTLTGQTDFNPIGAHGLLGVAVEAYQSAPDTISHSAVQIGTEGVLRSEDVIALLHPACVGDCDGDGAVRINELIGAINIGLGVTAMPACFAIDADTSGTASIDELTRAVGGALTGCPPRALPPTPIGATVSPTPTLTPPTVPGPDVTFFGIASGDDAPQQPIGTDDQGRPIFTWPVGQGFSLIVEARPGANRAQIGTRATGFDELQLPDLQLLVSRPLGNGDPTVCDADRPNLGGVPATVPLEFGPAPDVVRAINDLGCRADDGQGQPLGRRGIPCTRIPPANTPDFVSRSPLSQVQFCLPIARAWTFPEGDTTAAVRLRDITGEIGPAREIVIRIPAGP